MLDTASSRARRQWGAGWLAFAGANYILMFLLPGKETIPYHLIWASFALVYGFVIWPRFITRSCFWIITLATAIPMVRQAEAGIIGWEECSEIVLMGVIVALLMWHVDRQRAAQDRLQLQGESEARRNQNRQLTAQFGSHEVRTRLTIARGFVELIKNTSNQDAVRADAELVLGELDKASALATKLLTLVRVESPLPGEPLHLDDLLQVIMRRWEATENRRWSLASSVGITFGNSERVEAALDCLIENAVKFTTEGDRISVTAWREDRSVLISVADTGDGIPAADLRRILEVFQTGSSAGERAGSGLGLAIVNAIARARQGTLEVSSVEGHGACFTMRLPDVPGRPDSTTSVAELELPPAPRPTLLTASVDTGRLESVDVER
jgi:signal transduction histidine kinase